MKVVTFGEIMGRIAAPGHQRFIQCLPGTVDVTFAGAEANVAASLAMLGMEASLVTALPDHVIADACVASLRARNIDTRHIIRRAGRLGLYFLETGANQRASQVIYDRDGSSIGQATSAEFDWEAIFAGAAWLHVSGITPAISATAAETTQVAVERARAAGLKVSCDLNFRKKLWSWERATKPQALAERTLRRLLPHVDLLIANEEDCQDVLGIRAEGSDIHAGHLAIERYPQVAQEVIRQFPQLSYVAITLRESFSASHNNWGGMLYDVAQQRAHFAPWFENRYAPYEIKNIVDRVGAGDAFAAGLIFALNTPPLNDSALAVRFAVASSCLAHSIQGDFNYSSRSEIEALMNGSGSGRVVR